DDREACLKIVELVKAEFPLVPVLARSFDREHAAELVHAGVDWQIRETFESTLACAARALELCEVDEEERRRVMEDVRRRDAERFAIELTGGVYDDAARRLVRSNRQRNEAETAPDAP